MDVKESSDSDGRGCLTLHDDELLYLSKNYLKEQDCLSLAMSGVSDSYTSLYTANRKRVAIGRNSYHLTPTSWAEFFKECISHQSIITFDANHTYWLPPEVLLHSIVQMTNLEELCVHDTQISLSHLPEIFKNCPKLVKLTFTLEEETVNEDELKKITLKQLKKGFAQLTNLKILNFAPDDGNRRSFQSWLNLFQVLKWCQDCVYLVVKFASPERSESGHLYFERTTIEEDKLLDKIEMELFPLLLWMKNLKSLAIINTRHFHHDFHYYGVPITMGFPIMTRLLGLLLPQNKCLERLWIDDVFGHDGTLTGVPPFLKSWHVVNARETWDGFEGERFAQMEHVANVPLQNYDHLPHFQYVQGNLKSLNGEGFNDFGRSVPQLEHLHIDGSAYSNNNEEIEGDWSLPYLKILKFFGFMTYPEAKEFIKQLIQRCPNIEELCLWSPIDCFSEMKFNHLQRLRIISLSDDGSYLPKIFEQCPKLESLHLSGDSLPKVHFKQLSLCFPAAANLRDLRLAFKVHDDGDITLLVDLMKALLETVKSSNLKYFERFVLDVWDDEDLHLLKIAERNCPSCHPHCGCYSRVYNNPAVNCAELEEFIVEFAKGMIHLVCLGIFGFHIDPSAAEVIEKRLIEEVVPLRPAFWFHLGRRLPNENDASVPRVHYEEIVKLCDPCISIVPPDILNLK